MTHDMTFGWLVIVAMVAAVLMFACGWGAGFNQGQCTVRCAPSTFVRTAEECLCNDGRRAPLISPQDVR